MLSSTQILKLQKEVVEAYYNKVTTFRVVIKTPYGRIFKRISIPAAHIEYRRIKRRLADAIELSADCEVISVEVVK